MLSIKGLSKTFGATRALSEVDFDVAAGEVHALVGENGSGKSTLIKILSGFHDPDPGASARFDGAPLTLGRGTDSRILFVHQDRALIPSLSVRENLGLELGAGRVLGRLRNQEERRHARELLATFEIDIDVDALVGSLTPFEQSAVAIVRCLGALDDRARLLVLDEPTAALGSADAERLFEVLRRVNASGVALLYVSHFLDEVLAIADRISVLRDGRLVAVCDAATTSEAQLVELVVGHGLEQLRALSEPERRAGPPVLRVRGVRAPGLLGLDLNLAENEVLGLTGIVGSGYEVLPECLAGERAWDEGTVDIAGRSRTELDARQALAAGVVVMPADRMRRGLVGTLTVAENVTLPLIGDGWHGGRLHRRAIDEDVRRWILETGVVPPDPSRPVSQLSGGNQQKVLFAKALRLGPRILVVCEPTQAVDVGGSDAIRRLIARSATEPGRGVIVASSDATELVEICHRVLVFGGGTVRAELRGPEITEDRILHETHFPSESR